MAKEKDYDSGLHVKLNFLTSFDTSTATLQLTVILKTQLKWFLSSYSIQSIPPLQITCPFFCIKIPNHKRGIFMMMTIVSAVLRQNKCVPQCRHHSYMNNWKAVCYTSQ